MVFALYIFFCEGLEKWLMLNKAALPRCLIMVLKTCIFKNLEFKKCFCQGDVTLPQYKKGQFRPILLTSSMSINILDFFIREI